MNKKDTKETVDRTVDLKNLTTKSQKKKAVQIKEADSPSPNSSRITGLDVSGFSSYKILNHFEKLQQIAAGQIVSPITVEMDLSNRCNHRCQWCVNRESQNNMKEKLGLKSFKKLTADLAKYGTKSIVLKGGGEPTTNPEIVEMLYTARAIGLKVGVITNGSMPVLGTRQAILDNADWIRVSLDAANAHTHEQIHQSKDFEKIIDNVIFLADKTQNTLVGLNFVAEERNYDQILDFTKLAKRIGAAYVSIRRVSDHKYSHSDSYQKHKKIMYEQAVEAETLSNDHFRVLLGNFTDEYLDADPAKPFPFHKCLGPKLVGNVGADGEVYACCNLWGYKDFSFGSIHTQSFEQIWTGQKRKAVNEAILRGECGYVCMGVLTASRYNIYNQILNYLVAENKQHTEFA